MTQIMNETGFADLLKEYPKLEAFMNKEEPEVIDSKYISLAKLIQTIGFTVAPVEDLFKYIKDVTSKTKQQDGKFDFDLSANICYIEGEDMGISSKTSVSCTEVMNILEYIKTIQYVYVSALLYRFDVEHVYRDDIPFLYEKFKNKIFIAECSFIIDNPFNTYLPFL